jgi:opacity protein-like surface antigen
MKAVMSRTILFVVTLAAGSLPGGIAAARADTTGNTADTTSTYNPTDYVTPYGPYVGIGWGHFNLHLDNLDEVGQQVNSIVHSGHDAWKVQLGYRFTPYFALEGDYMNFGTSSDTFVGTGSNGNYNLHMSGFAPYGVLTLPIGPVELYGKAGWLYYNSDLRVNLNAPGTQLLESSHSHSDFTWGGGLGVTVARHVNVSAEYDRIKVVNAPDSNALWLNVAWRF